ncbi:MAG: Rap1a/Tai family immunity protein [Alphaproteobacteria bacterium]
MRALPMIATMLIVAFAAVPSRAQLAVTTADLAAACGDTDQGGNVCTGYLLGLADLQKALALMSNGQPFFCTPPVYGAGTLVDALTTWLEANPDAAGLPAMNGAIAALQAAFPCGG